MQTCMPTCDNPAYMLLGLQGEVGELSEKFAKIIRKGALRFASVKTSAGGELHNHVRKSIYFSYQRFTARPWLTPLRE